MWLFQIWFSHCIVLIIDISWISYLFNIAHIPDYSPVTQCIETYDLTHCTPVTPYVDIDLPNIGIDDSLLPDGTKS